MPSDPPTPTTPPTTPQPGFAARVAVDAHVHLYPPVDPAALLDAAARHRPPGTGARDLVLCLTDTAGSRGFDRLPDGGSGPWHTTDTAEPFTRLCVHGGHGARVFVINGYQSRTAERLEVLALGTNAAPRDGQPLEDALQNARTDGALTVLPWGVGKWSGARQALVRDAIDRHAAWLCLGDNGNRTRGPAPALLRHGAARGLPVLPGTDPLPLTGDHRRVGSFGALAAGPLDAARPAAWLAAAVRDPACAWAPFGAGASLPTLLWRQLRLRTGPGRMRPVGAPS